MVITGIVAGIVAVFMTLPITGYIDSVRRAGMTDIADLALRRMGYELRRAVPNSVRVPGESSTDEIEFVPAKDGGRYRLLGPGRVLDGTETGSFEFDVLGREVEGDEDDFVVIFNTGQDGLDLYLPGLDNRRRLSAAAGSTVSYTGNGAAFPTYHSPTQRFQIVPKEGPVRYRCSGGNLVRETRYDASFVAGAPPIQTATLASGVSCLFEYKPVNATNGLVTIRLTVTREGESVTLVHQIHVDNTP